jgi:dihydrodipicolinate synthase/N-acetylneuraminate lyase
VISGVYVPLLTAFAGDGAVDPAGFARQAQWLAERGTDWCRSARPAKDRR